MIYLLIFLILFAVELLYFRIADRYNIIDKPNERSSHTKVTLRGGGIIFYVAILIYFIYSSFSYPYFFAGLTLITFVSFLDDIKPRSAKIRILIHLCSIFLIFYQWNLFSSVWYILPLALIFCLGIINAYNFMDGINGITGGYSFIVAFSFLYINLYQIKFIDNNLIIILLLSLLVFNFFNFRTKAKCFAGDIGAVSIAFIVIFLLGKLMIATNDFSYIILLIVYGVDSVMTIFHRIVLKENLAKAHRKHLFQLMANELKIPHIKVSLIYMLVQSVITAGFFLTTNHYIYVLGVIIVLCTTYLIFMKKFFHLHKG